MGHTSRCSTQRGHKPRRDLGVAQHKSMSWLCCAHTKARWLQPYGLLALSTPLLLGKLLLNGGSLSLAVISINLRPSALAYPQKRLRALPCDRNVSTIKPRLRINF